MKEKESKPKKAKKEKDPNKPKRVGRTHSQKTRDLISERRRARTVQPRHIGQSSKRKSFYDELNHEWSKVSEKKISDKKRVEIEAARKWIQENKENLGHVEGANDFRLLEPYYEKYGILTEYKEMYHSAYEERVGDVLYSDERTPTNETSNDPYDIVANMNEDYSEIFGGDFDAE